MSFVDFVNFTLSPRLNSDILVMSAVSGENVENVLRELKKFVIKDNGENSTQSETERDDSPWNI